MLQDILGCSGMLWDASEFPFEDGVWIQGCDDVTRPHPLGAPRAVFHWRSPRRQASSVRAILRPADQ